MNGYGDFLYAADYAYQKNGDKEFLDARQWCTETFGPSLEIDLWQTYGTDLLKNPKWSWERGDFAKTYRCRIFIADQQTANWFTLRFGAGV